MKKNLSTLFIIFVLSSTAVYAKRMLNNDEQIKAVIFKTFSSMKMADSSTLKSCFMNKAILHVSQIKAKNTSIKEVPIALFVNNVGSRKPGELDERVLSWGPIQIDHEIASAWVPYEFYLNGKFSHKGVDVFLLVKVGDDWKIQTLMYNMQKE